MPRGRRPESILVRLTADDGSVGWGEVSPAVDTSDTSDTSEADRIWSDIEERIAPALLGLDWERPEDVAGPPPPPTPDPPPAPPHPLRAPRLPPPAPACSSRSPPPWPRICATSIRPSPRSRSRRVAPSASACTTSAG